MISFILTVLNRSDLVASFFAQSMAKQIGTHEVVVIDNGSGRQTADFLDFLATRCKSSKLRIFHNVENTGFGVGNNQGAVESKGDVLVFTQPDVVIHEDVTNKLESLNSDILYGNRLLDYDTGWNRFGNVVVPYLEGHFIACTRETWFKIGGFDPIYFPADFEDVDLSYTAAKLGIPLKQLDLRMTHLFGGTWSQFTDRQEVTIRNRAKFADKWGLQCQ